LLVAHIALQRPPGETGNLDRRESCSASGTVEQPCAVDAKSLASDALLGQVRAGQRRLSSALRLIRASSEKQQTSGKLRQQDCTSEEPPASARSELRSARQAGEQAIRRARLLDNLVTLQVQHTMTSASNSPQSGDGNDDVQRQNV